MGPHGNDPGNAYKRISPFNPLAALVPDGQIGLPVPRVWLGSKKYAFFHMGWS